MSAKIQQDVIDELRLCVGGTAPTKAELRTAIGCTAGEIAAAVQSLRYQGKVSWDRLELSPSMLAGTEAREGEPAAGASLPPAPTAWPDEDDGPDEDLPGEIRAGPDDHDDYPGEVNDQAEHSIESSAAVPPAQPEREAPAVSPLRHRAGVHGAMTRAAARPVPIPAHEPEVERQVREEVEESLGRRRRAVSTGTVRQPLELRKFGVPDLNVVEAVTSLVAQDPHDLIAAVNRKHPKLWRRLLLLGRARGERPAAALYAVLEAGLEQLETTGEVQNAA